MGTCRKCRQVRQAGERTASIRRCFPPFQTLEDSFAVSPNVGGMFGKHLQTLEAIFGKSPDVGAHFPHAWRMGLREGLVAASPILGENAEAPAAAAQV